MNKKSVRAILLAATLLVGACHGKKATPPQLSISVAKAQYDSVTNRQSYIGTTAANFEAVIQPRVAGFLTASLFDNGMPVRRGQLIFTLDGREQRANKLAAAAALESAKAKAIEARNAYKRAVPLAKIDAISRAQLDQYTASYAAAQAAVNSAEQALSNATLAVSYTDIYSPIDGVISSSAAHIGDYVGPGTKFSTLTSIQNLDTISVDVAIPMNQYLEFSGRQALSYDNKALLSDIRLYLADGSLYPEAGFYKFTRASIPNSMGTIVLVIGFPNRDYRLKAGEFARIEANVGAPQRLITVPQNAISRQQNITSVWVMRPDSTVEFRKVSLGAIANGQQIITQGISAGEWVALTGQDKLRDGAKISPIMEEQSHE